MSTLDRLVARLLSRWLREPIRQVLAGQDPRQAGPEAHVEMYKYLVHGDRARLRIHPTTGLALPWNPTKDRGVGGKDLYVTSQGLWVGSDTNRIGGETRRRIALLPVP